MFWSQTIKIKTAFDLYFILGGGKGSKIQEKKYNSLLLLSVLQVKNMYIQALLSLLKSINTNLLY